MKTLSSIRRTSHEGYTNDLIEIIRDIELYEMVFVRNIEICNCSGRVIVFGKGIEIRQWWCLCGCRDINCRFVETCVLTLNSWEFVAARKARRARESWLNAIFGKFVVQDILWIRTILRKFYQYLAIILLIINNNFAR